MKKAFLTLTCAKGEGSEFPVTKGMQTVVVTVIAITVTIHTPVSASGLNPYWRAAPIS